MSSTVLAAPARPTPSLRALNVLRDLPQVADLIEVCFATTMDRDGRRYVSEMRRAGKSSRLSSLAQRVGDSASLPLSGYIWEEGGRVVGNVSLIPFRISTRRIYLIANVAVHPEYRRRGIGRALTLRALQHAREKSAQEAWLSVRAENTAAVQLYGQLGFREMARRTSWIASERQPDEEAPAGFEITARGPQYWKQQRMWLGEGYPLELSWHRRWDFSALRPGILTWIFGLLLDLGIRQWAAVKASTLHAVMAYMPTGQDTVLFPAIGPDADPAALTTLLLHARRHLPPRPQLTVELPQGRLDEAIAAAGFAPQRTLVWMVTTPATLTTWTA